MLKIGKGLKKKKKSKKKHKEAELFTEEELERYKREHAQNKEEGTSESKPSEEFEKFKALTAGVDDILKKSQGDLDRIKKESFFQRKPTPSELQKLEDERKRVEEEELRRQQALEEEKNKNTLQVEEFDEGESEYETDEGDDLFDTAYVDAIASGEVKLAYVPDDDEDFNDGPDPFDTTTADEILKKAEEKEKQKKKEISLGLAVNVLTGRAERDRTLLGDNQPKEETQSRTPRARPRKIQDFSLLGSFDDNGNLKEPDAKVEVLSPSVELVKSLLDDDLEVDQDLPEGETLLNEVLIKNIVESKEEEKEEENLGPGVNNTLKDVVSEFDVINEERVSEDVRKAEEIDDEFDEFTALAESSLANQKLEEELQQFEDTEDDPFDTTAANILLREEKVIQDPFGEIDQSLAKTPEIEILCKGNKNNWTAFEEPKVVEETKEVDPFDTSFADAAQPGKCELKLIENEILGEVKSSRAIEAEIYNEARILSRSDSDIDFNPREGEIPSAALPQLIQQRVSIQITDPSGLVEIQRASESSEPGLVSLTLGHRDLLGGSNTDLSSLGQDPISPKADSPTEDYSDPFDTSVVDQVALPGKAELAFLEKELLSDIPAVEIDVLKDDDFDPREEELGRLNKQVQFEVPSPLGSDLLDSEKSEGIRPLTPYYADNTNICSESSDIDDPFDTSHVISLPGKVELKFIEQELENIKNNPAEFVPIHERLGIIAEDTVQTGLKHSLSDQDFNPREESTTTHTIEISSDNTRRYSDFGGVDPPRDLSLNPVEKPDLFSVEEEHSTKALTPAKDDDAYIDPFDTSIAENIVPGQAELRILEKELIDGSEPVPVEGSIKRSYTDPDFNPRDEPQANGVTSQQSDILNLPEDHSGAKPLTPVDLDTADIEEDDVDPFDTSIALNILPGKAELRLLESELIGQ